MKKLLLLIALSFFSTQGFAGSCPDGSEPQKTVSADGTYFVYKCAADSNDAQSKTKTQSSHKLDTPANWPSGIKYAGDASANAILYFDEAVKPERLYINSHDRPPHNVAYTGNIETPISYYGFWPKGAYSKYSPYMGDFKEKFVYEQEIDEIVDGNDHAQRAHDIENKEVFSYHLQKFHNGDKSSLKTLKSLMFEWVNGPYWKAMIPDRELACTSCSNEQPIWEGYNHSIIGELWNTLIPMLEVHITLIREKAYSPEEYDQVHNWLEKRVWLAEQGPGEGQLAAAHRWIPDPGPPNHHKYQKTLAYLMWGIADQNSEYFTAGVRGVDAYHNVLRDDGSIKTEHFYNKACQTGFGDHGCISGLSLGNQTSRFYTLAALLMHNQGIDVRKKYPKIEKNIEWTSKVAVDPSLAMKWIGNIFISQRKSVLGETFSKEGIVMDWARNDGSERKNLVQIHLWDKIFKTNYVDNLNGVVVIDQGIEQEIIYDHRVRRGLDFGFADVGLITFNSDEVATGIALNEVLSDGTYNTDFNLVKSNSINEADYTLNSKEIFLDGGSSEKFSIQPLNCDLSKSADCNNNHQRVMMIEKDRVTGEETKLYEWSMFVPESNIFPNGAHLKYVIFQAEENCQGGDPITFMEFGNPWAGFRFSLADSFNRDEATIIKTSGVTGKWHNFKLEVKWSRNPEKGYIKLMLNDIFVDEYFGKTLRCNEVQMMYGLLRAQIKKSNLVKSISNSVYFDNVKISNIDNSNPSIFLNAKLGKSNKKIEANNIYDGEYTFRLYVRFDGEGNSKIGSGLFEIKNGNIIFINKKQSQLKTGSTDFYDTLEGHIDEDGQVYGSIELDILNGKDRSEIYTLKGPIKGKIWGDSPDECCARVYFLPRLKK